MEGAGPVAGPATGPWTSPSDAHTSHRFDGDPQTALELPPADRAPERVCHQGRVLGLAAARARSQSDTMKGARQ